MISRLASGLVQRYVPTSKGLLDPFCGSGAVLVAASDCGIPVTGLDVNPYAVLLTDVKLAGFHAVRAKALCAELIREAQYDCHRSPVEWDAKHYWFTPTTLSKYEQLRRAAQRMDLGETSEGKAVLLAFALSVRRCSRADQRSPKPFISKTARHMRSGKHFDPCKTIEELLEELGMLYGKPTKRSYRVVCLDVTRTDGIDSKIGLCSHVITSPPYINAQDYFRNFKLELYLLEGILPYRVRDLKGNFIGTERGDLLGLLADSGSDMRRNLLPTLVILEQRNPRLAAVVHRYLHDMGMAFDSVKSCLTHRAVFVIVCGDNLVGGTRIRTWQILNTMLEQRGFRMFDSFKDKIECRSVPPKRCGHKGLIKEEVISAFRLSKQS